MIEKALPCGRSVKIDEGDEPLFARYAWHAHQVKQGRWYVSAVQDGKRLYLHRLIMQAVGRSQKVDHRDGDGFNNQRYNLRKCTNAQNMRNMQRGRGKSQFKGVAWFKRDSRWRAYIVLDAKQIHLGYFDAETDAARAYDTAALKYFGAFARLNFPTQAAA